MRSVCRITNVNWMLWAGNKATRDYDAQSAN